MHDESCVFCGIVAGTEPASVVVAEGDVIAFADLNPVNPGHILVVPRLHAVGLADLPSNTGGRMFHLAQRVAEGIRALPELRAEGINLFLADGVAAGQEVFHVHLHVFPRFKGDAFRLSSGQRRATRAELDAVAQSLCQLV
ncbi:HIT family protein [Pseudonocardiaceae bacterium YIM PH 21723]|nr:HIT family protein [Pseudonocardiaceae bacterium YIM PH 21723]